MHTLASPTSSAAARQSAKSLKAGALHLQVSRVEHVRVGQLRKAESWVSWSWLVSRGSWGPKCIRRPSQVREDGRRPAQLRCWASPTQLEEWAGLG